VGDLVDRGPCILDTVRLVRNMVAAGSAFCVPGNHDMKLMRKLRGKNLQISHGLAQSLAELDALPNETRDVFSRELSEFLGGLGGRAAALGCREHGFVPVSAADTSCGPARPCIAADRLGPELTAPQEHRGVLRADGVRGELIITPRLRGGVTVRGSGAAGALD